MERVDFYKRKTTLTKEMLSKGLGKPKILVVDDDPSIAEAIKAALEGEGYEVITSFSGEDALKKLREKRIDIAFFDVKMPGMDGVELLKRTKKMSPDTYVIMLTAYASVDTAVEAMKEGAADYIRKPFELKDIKSTVLGALEDIEFEKRRGALVSAPAEEEMKDAFEEFKNLMKGGRRGLVVSRRNARELRERYGLDGVTYVLLSEEEGGHHPQRLDELRELILGFASSNPDSVILMGDIDYLLDKNPLPLVRDFLEGVEEGLASSNVVLILSGDPKNMDRVELEELHHLISEVPVGIISSSLSNQLRRKIISQLSFEDGISFTTLARRIGISDSPKLSFHLQKLESGGLIRKDEEKKYFLTEMGRNAARILEQIKRQHAGKWGKVVWIPR